MMALANLAHSDTRRAIHLFDSFEGIPEPRAGVDGSAAEEFARKAGGGVSGALKALPDQYGGVGTVEVVQSLLHDQIGYPREHSHYHVGWFQDTVPLASDVGPIAILRLDGDWYDSTIVCLRHLYDKVVPGGFVIVDDYGAYEGCRKAVDEFVAGLAAPVFLSHLDRWGRYWIKN